MENEKLLHEVIEGCLENLRDTDANSDEYKTIADTTAKLLDKAIEIDKLNVEHEEQVQKLETETNLKREQLDEEKKDRWVKNGLTAFSVVSGLVMTYWGTKKTFKFEETGTITSMPGRNFINKAMNYFTKK